MLLLNKDIYKVIFRTKYTNKYIYFNPNSICGVVDRITLRILNVSRDIFADEAFIRSRVLRHVRFIKYQYQIHPFHFKARDWDQIYNNKKRRLSLSQLPIFIEPVLEEFW